MDVLLAQININHHLQKLSCAYDNPQPLFVAVQVSALDNHFLGRVVNDLQRSI
jgi:hypothetical protein